MTEISSAAASPPPEPPPGAVAGPPMLPPGSPLSAVSLEQLQIYFASDPQHLTDAELDQIVAYYRSERVRWAQSEDAKATKEKKAKVTVNPTLAGLELEDLL